jgi:hypothetical protein
MRSSAKSCSPLCAAATCAEPVVLAVERDPRRGSDARSAVL